jgi:hypothetical protein
MVDKAPSLAPVTVHDGRKKHRFLEQVELMNPVVWFMLG